LDVDRQCIPVPDDRVTGKVSENERRPMVVRRYDGTNSLSVSKMTTADGDDLASLISERADFKYA